MVKLTISESTHKLHTGLGKMTEQLSSEALIMTRILSAFNLLKRVGFAFLLLLDLCSIAPAQPYEPPDTLWTRTFEYDGGVNIRGAIFLPNGTIVITGHLADTGLGQGLFYLVVTSTGETIDFDLYPDDLLIVDGGFVTQTSDGGFALAGTLEIPNAADFRIDKLDSNGALIWERDYPMLGIQEASSIIGLPDGNLLLGGASTRASQPTKFFWMKINGANGDTIWTQQLDQYESDPYGIKSIALDQDNSFLLLGSTNYPDSSNQTDFLFVRSSPEGDVGFAHTYGRNLIDDGFSISAACNGDYVLGGGSVTSDSAAPMWEAYHVRITAEGDTVWTDAHLFGNGHFSQTHKLIGVDNNGFYSTGKAFDSGYKVRLSRHNFDGEIEWEGLYGLSFSSGGNHAEAVDSLGRFVVAYVSVPGEMIIFLTEPDPVLSSSEEYPLLPSSVEIQLLIYPNPFNATTTLKILAPLHVVADITIMNLLGQTVATPFHGKVIQSPFLLSIDGTQFSSGVYFARLQIEQTQTSTQLILLK